MGCQRHVKMGERENVVRRTEGGGMLVMAASCKLPATTTTRSREREGPGDGLI
jgi:hypothetical protein